MPRGDNAGRPSLGHAGHGGRADRCPACRLRRARERLGLSQAELGGRIRRGLRTVQRWEREPGGVDLALLELVEGLAGSLEGIRK